MLLVRPNPVADRLSALALIRRLGPYYLQPAPAPVLRRPTT
jgi:hypothetical protein